MDGSLHCGWIDCGLLRVRDIASDGATEILVREFLDHHLKSPSARRRIPIALMATADELRALLELPTSYIGEQDAKRTDFVFSTGADGSKTVSPTIFLELNKIIAWVTGTFQTEHPTRYHHLRHAFASFSS
jgi:hypothetical protein